MTEHSVPAVSRPSRILLVAAANATSGGGEKHVADLVRLLPQAGFEVALIAPPGGDLGQLAAELGVRAFAAPIDAGISLSHIRAVRRAIEEFVPDIVHAHGSRAAAFARLADPLARSRVVYTVHGIHVAQSGGLLRRRALTALERLLRPRTAAFVTVAESDRAKGASLGILDPTRATTVYNGIELPPPAGTPGAFRKELGLSLEAPLVLSIGRFHQQKDQRTLLAAFARVLASVPRAHLALVGSGALEAALREQVASLGIGAAVSIVPPRSNIADAYEDADIVALSSLWEGLPYVIIEAMAHGLPVVATSVDGIPEAVEQEATGLLAPPSDSASLADALTRVLADASLREAMGERARAVVRERFALPAMIDGLTGVYERVRAGSTI